MLTIALLCLSLTGQSPIGQTPPVSDPATEAEKAFLEWLSKAEQNLAKNGPFVVEAESESVQESSANGPKAKIQFRVVIDKNRDRFRVEAKSADQKSPPLVVVSDGKSVTLVLFSGFVTSACGGADAAVGPFYCPGDSKVYIDLSFYNDMERKLNAPGEFARAYVIAHEVGHHVQRLLGYSQRVDQIRRQGNPIETNKASVRLELQADYLAGVWAHHGQKRYKFLEPGDIESALNAAFEIGDDRLQKKSRGTVVPDAFTHGTSQQRQRWFTKGYQSGDVGGARELFELPYDGL